MRSPQLNLILDPKPFTLYPSLTALDPTLDAVIPVPEVSLFIPVPAVSRSIPTVDLHGLHGIEGIGSGKDAFRSGPPNRLTLATTVIAAVRAIESLRIVRSNGRRAQGNGLRLRSLSLESLRVAAHAQRAAIPLLSQQYL